ncbi:MAG TPA: hypothetical protein VFI73_01640 [Candidatus Nitrosopolaris sp.]|nr:hypothetical protein [Candidatus Nitrosopolaris sp.]
MEEFDFFEEIFEFIVVQFAAVVESGRRRVTGKFKKVGGSKVLRQ